jgi:branched-chain amino acid transport system substrate-binding protein
MASSRRLVLGSGLALVLGLTACGGGGSSSSSSGSGGGSTDPIKIGVIAPLSGDSAAAGTDIVNGAKLAADKINKAGGVLGRQITLVQADDGCDAQTGTSAVQKLVTQKVVTVAGGYCSGAAIAETVITNRNKIPYIACAATSVTLTNRGLTHVFRTLGRDDRQGEFAAQYMVKDLKAKNIAIINDNTAYAKGLADATKASLEKLGTAPVFFDAITPGAKDFNSFLTGVRGKQPDATYFTGYFADAGLLLKQARDLGITTPIIGGDATNDPTVPKTAGKAAEGFTVTTAPLPQFIAAAAPFVTSYKAAYSTGPGPYSVYEYDAVAVAADAIKRAGSTDSQKITDALKQTKDFQGLTGKIAFEDTGDRANPVYITAVIKSGEFVPARTLDPATGMFVDYK